MAERCQGRVNPVGIVQNADLAAWEGFGELTSRTRREQGLSLRQLADIAVTTPELLEQLEAGECDPGRRLAQDLDRALNLGGRLWDSWAGAHLSSLFHAGRLPTITDVLPEVFQVRAYAPLVLPEPYLTDSYAAALQRAERPMSSPDLDGDRPLLGRLPTTSAGAPFHCLVVDETALVRHLAPADVIRGQLLHLHHLAQADRISVHLIPAHTGPHPGLRGAFWTLCFAPAHTIVYIPHPCGPGHLLTEPTTVKAYIDLFATLQGAALPTEDSLHRLTTLAARTHTAHELATG